MWNLEEKTFQKNGEKEKISDNKFRIMLVTFFYFLFSEFFLLFSKKKTFPQTQSDVKCLI